MTERSRKFCEGWLEHKAHRPTGYKYEKLYVLLQGNVIYIFSSDTPSEDTQIGNLTLDSNTEFIVRKGSHSKGFKFDLNTGKRLNRFKAPKNADRELWRGYVVGISKGDVPKDLDLLDSEVKIIRRDVAAFHGAEEVDYDPKRSSIASSHRSMQSRGLDSGVVSLGGTSRHSGSSSDDSRSRRTNASSATSASGTINNGGPTVVHKFYNDRNRDQAPPSWFIPHCSREMAEKLLERANSNNYGNTLMRESTSHLSNGSYVISKLNVNKRDGRIDFEHFEVIRTVQGYKVNVENQHPPMKCLKDVMDYFIGTSGGSTRPLEVNDPKVLGQDVPGYSTQIHYKRPESWKWPPADSRDEPVPVGNQQQYYDESGQAPDNSRFRNIEGSQTVSAGILRNQRPLPSPGAAERKSVGWSSVINTPPPLQDHANTFAGTRARPGLVPSMSELAQRSQEADQINQFDTMLSGFESGFERDTVYINQSSGHVATPYSPPPPPVAHQLERPRSYVNVKPNVSQAPSPVPPAPSPPAAHQPERPRSYVNVNVNQQTVRRDPALDALPVAPPAPRDPIVSSPPSTNLRHSASSVSSAGISASSKSPASSVYLRNSTSFGSNNSNTAQTQANVSKSFSESHLKNVRSPDSPKNFPTWGTPKPNISSPNPTKTPEVVSSSASSATPEVPQAGVDDKTPGGVSTLRGRFESTSSPSSTPIKHGNVRNSLPVKWSLSNQLSETLDELDDLYDYLSEDGADHATNKSVQITNKTNKKRSMHTQSMIINSNVNNDSLLAAGSTHSLKSLPSQTTPPSMHDSRQRFSSPDDVIYDDTVVPQQEPSGLNKDFKNKLEGLFGGNTAGPNVTKGPRKLPAAPFTRQFSAEDHEYQELPDVIPPDSVTYVNDRFNADHDDT